MTSGPDRPTRTAAEPRDGGTPPFISVVIPVLNEERHIRDCLASVFAQEYPTDRFEVIVADGGSADRTCEIVAEIAAAQPALRLVDNPARNQAAGLNRAIAVARGEIIARLDGHAAWRPWHLRRCVELLAETGADNVGGRMEAVGETAVAEAVARATSSPLGVGEAHFHYATRAMDTETVFLGCFRREALDRVGPFNESYPPHEDYELNHRIRQGGGRIVYSPDIPTTYWARATWRTLIRQYFRYGRAKTRVARHTPGVVRRHHLAPPTLVASLPLAAVGLAWQRPRRAVVALAGLYAAACLVEGARKSRGAAIGVRLRVPLVFPVLHLSWGAGFWAGLVSPGRSGPVTRARQPSQEQVRPVAARGEDRDLLG